MADTAIKTPPKEEPRKHPPQKLRKGSPMMNPPLTALIDVFLFLIIFFLLSCQFLQREGTIPANLPATLSGGEGAEVTVRLDPIRILLTPADSTGENVNIEIADVGRKLDSGTDENGNITSPMEELYSFLNQKKESLGGNVDKLPIIIKPGAGVRWGSVVDAFNQAVRAGMKEVGVAPSQPPT